MLEFPLEGAKLRKSALWAQSVALGPLKRTLMEDAAARGRRRFFAGIFARKRQMFAVRGRHGGVEKGGGGGKPHE